MSEDYPYLSSLSNAEFGAMLSLVEKHGFKGLLSAALELAQWNVANNRKADEMAMAERVARELATCIERLDGCEKN